MKKIAIKINTIIKIIFFVEHVDACTDVPKTLVDLSANNKCLKINKENEFYWRKILNIIHQRNYSIYLSVRNLIYSDNNSLDLDVT